MTSILASRRIQAPKELLWDYLSTSSGLSCWQADSVDGDLASGRFSFRWPKLGARLDLSIAQVDPGERLVLRAGANVLTLTLTEGEVSLTHEGLAEDDDLEGFRSSWNAALSILELAATHHPRLPRRVDWMFQPAPTEATLARCFFTDPEALQSWMGTTRAELKRGESYKLELFGGHRLSGSVLFDERDVCLHVRELENGAVSFRTLPGAEGQRLLTIGVSTWGNPCPADLRDALEGALHRLAQLMRTGNRQVGSYD